MKKILQELYTREESLREEIITLKHDLEFIKKNKSTHILNHVSNYDIKKYCPSYHSIDELQNSYMYNRDVLLNIYDPFSDDDEEYINQLEIIKSNIKKKECLIDIKEKKLIVIKAWYDCIDFVNTVQGTVVMKKQLIKNQMNTPMTYLSKNNKSYIYIKGKIECFKHLLQLL